MHRYSEASRPCSSEVHRGVLPITPVRTLGAAHPQRGRPAQAMRVSGHARQVRNVDWITCSVVPAAGTLPAFIFSYYLWNIRWKKADFFGNMFAGRPDPLPQPTTSTPSSNATLAANMPRGVVSELQSFSCSWKTGVIRSELAGSAPVLNCLSPTSYILRPGGLALLILLLLFFFFLGWRVPPSGFPVYGVALMCLMHDHVHGQPQLYNTASGRALQGP